MKTKHSLIRAQQRGIKDSIQDLLLSYGDMRSAPNGCVIRFFGKKAIKEIESVFGHSFIAKNHENLRSYLIEARDDHSIVTVGKLYSSQRLCTKVNRIYH